MHGLPYSCECEWKICNRRLFDNVCYVMFFWIHLKLYSIFYCEFSETMDSSETKIQRKPSKKKRNANDTQTMSPPHGMVVLNIIYTHLQMVKVDSLYKNQ